MADNEKRTEPDDIQAELEARFDELFGSLDDEPDAKPEDENAARRRHVDELWDEGYDHFRRSDHANAIDRFHEAAELAAQLEDVDKQCENLYWEANCWSFLGKLKTALDLLLRAEELGGGDGGVRFLILHSICIIASCLPLSKAQQEELLKKLAPYKGVAQIGGSKSAVLDMERQFLRSCGDKRGALYRAQEAFDCQVDEYPSVNDGVYYDSLIDCYRENGLLSEARRTLSGWRMNGSTDFANTKSLQFRAEAQILHAEGRLEEAWEAIRTCQAEERDLGIYGETGTVTLRWLVRIGTDAGKLEEVRPALPLLYRWRNSDSLYDQFDCFYYHACYYAGLARYLTAGGGGSRYGTAEAARARARRWGRQAEAVGRELDRLMETDVKQKELDELRLKLGWG